MECLRFWYTRPRRSNVTWFHSCVDVWFGTPELCAPSGISIEGSKRFCKGPCSNFIDRQSLMDKQRPIKCGWLLHLGMEGKDKGWKVGRYKNTKGLEKSYTKITIIEASLNSLLSCLCFNALSVKMEFSHKRSVKPLLDIKD